MKIENLKFRRWHFDLEDMIYSTDNLSDFFLLPYTYPNTYIIMQYSGLKDKTGKEIFEGDIVFCQLEQEVECEVVFFAGCFHLKDKHKNYTPLFDYGTPIIKIITNIYEK